MAITHHIIVQYAAHLSGRKSIFKGYLIIGDDIAIFDKSVSTQYKKLLSDLGMPINMGKSVISESYPYCGEIAKRLFFNGNEITPVPPDIISAAVKDYKVVPQLITQLCELG